MLTRRRALGVVGLTVAGSSAGCLDRIPFIGDDPIEFESSPASVAETVLDDTGYEDDATEEVVIEESFEVSGRSQDVVVTNWQTSYEKSINLGAAGLPIDQEAKAAMFTVLSTPRVSVLGRTFNPVGDMSSQELAEMILDRYDGMSDITRIDEETATVSGTSTTVGTFDAEAEFVAAGESIEIRLNIAEAVESGDDLLVAIGAYPKEFADEEAGHVFSMMDAVIHEG